MPHQTHRAAMVRWLRAECRRYAEHHQRFKHDPARRQFSEQCWRKATVALAWWRKQPCIS